MNDALPGIYPTGIYVGPPHDPDRLRLIALLGAGGEGEVWRAVWRLSEDPSPVAVKISSATRGDQAVWDEWARTVTTLHHPSLVHMVETFLGAAKHPAGSADQETHYRHEVMDFVDGMSLAEWSTENPDASIRTRRRFLLQIASALDALHDGTIAGAPAAHGDVKPHNIIITPQGRAVLVDLGLARLAHSSGVAGRSNAYAPPEGRGRDTRAEPSADAYAFALTAAVTYAGITAPVGPDGYLDPTRLRRALRRSPRTGRRPVLRCILLRAINTVPEQRPRRLIGWIRRPRRLAGAALVAVVALAASASVAAAVAALHRSSARHQVAAQIVVITTPQQPPASARSLVLTSSPARVAASFRSALVAQVDWPGLNAAGLCGATMQVAGPRDVSLNTFFSGIDIRTAITRAGGGAWLNGTLTATFSANSHSSIRLLQIGVQRSTVAPPSWVFAPAPVPSPTITAGGTPVPTPACTTGNEPLSQQGFWSADIDHGAITFDQGQRLPVVLGAGGQADTFYTAIVSSRTCVGDYKWSLIVRYQQGQDRTVRTLVTDPVQLYGLARDTDVRLGYQNSSGGATIIAHATRSGSDPSCTDAGATRPFAPVPVPYATSGTVTITPATPSRTSSAPPSHTRSSAPPTMTPTSS